jgi:DNA topoisomerase IA
MHGVSEESLVFQATSDVGDHLYQSALLAYYRSDEDMLTSESFFEIKYFGSSASSGPTMDHWYRL